MKKLYRYLITIAIGLVMTFLVLLSKGAFGMSNTKDIIHTLSDAFIVPGVVITGIGLLVFATNEGVFDIIVYGVGQFVKMFSANPSRRKYKDFNEYREVKRSTKLSFGYIVIVGVIFLAISIILSLVWYKL